MNDTVTAALGCAALCFDAAYYWTPPQVLEQKYGSRVERVLAEDDNRDMGPNYPLSRRWRSLGDPMADMFADTLLSEDIQRGR